MSNCVYIHHRTTTPRIWSTSRRRSWRAATSTATARSPRRSSPWSYSPSPSSQGTSELIGVRKAHAHCACAVACARARVRNERAQNGSASEARREDWRFFFPPISRRLMAFSVRMRGTNRTYTESLRQIHILRSIGYLLWMATSFLWIILASTRNSTPDTYWKKTPTKARPKDQLR